MRSTWDRIRHALSFEIIGLMIVVPLGVVAFDRPIDQMGVVAIVGATLATGWNYVYNLLFDHAMLRIAGHARKSVALRVLHAVLFEAGLLAALLPFIAWHLKASVAEAFMIDAGFAAFYLVYAFVFNWAYDLVFPAPAPGRGRAHGAR